MGNNQRECFDPKYYTIGKLTDVSLFTVSRSLKYFLRDYQVTYPVDCFSLVEQIQNAGKIHLEVQIDNRLSDAFEASAIEVNEVNSYLIVMKPVPKDWTKRSSWRRCNFTLAHELGHLFCGHLRIPRKLKSEEDKLREDLEADEFAGRLLMPEKMILRSQVYSRSSLAEAFLVSEQACYKRLNNLKRLDLYQAPTREACSECGNDHISPAAEYCEICGEYLLVGGKQSVRIVEYTRPMTNKDNRVIFCPVCGNEQFSDRAKYCKICGTPAYNYCCSDNTFWPCDHVNSPNARYCEICGGKTVFNVRGLLMDWKEEKEEYIRAITQF